MQFGFIDFCLKSSITDKAKILLKFFYMVVICKLEVMDTITW